MSKLLLMILVCFSPALALAEGLIEAKSYSESYLDNMKMREERRVGVGADFGGSAGLAGVHVELNIEDSDGAVAGFGLANGFSTFSAAWKHNFEGLYLSPYTTLGWSRWYSSAKSGRPESYILDSVLTQTEKDNDQFGVDFLMAGAGLQYNQLDGDLAGATFFAEVELFAPPFRAGVMPSASLGATYFF